MEKKEHKALWVISLWPGVCGEMGYLNIGKSDITAAQFMHFPRTLRRVKYC